MFQLFVCYLNTSNVKVKRDKNKYIRKRKEDLNTSNVKVKLAKMEV